MSTSLKLSKQNRSKRKSISLRNSSNIVSYIFILLISMFIIVVPFFRGLYFRENYIPSNVYIGSVFMIYIFYKISKNDFKLFSSYLDIAIILMPLAYLISFFFSVNAKEAFDAVIKYSSYFMIYKITSDISSEHKYRKLFEYVLAIAMFIIATTSLMAAFGYIDLKGAISGKRIYGAYQYSNATAAVMGAAVFFTLGYAINTITLYKKIIYHIVLALVFPVFVLTLSRGAYIVFAFLAVLNLLLLRGSKRIDYIYSAFSLIATDSVFLFMYYRTSNSHTSAIYLALALIAYIISQLLYEKYIRRMVERMSTKAINIAIFSLIITSIATLMVLLNYRVPIEYKLSHASGEEESFKRTEISINNMLPDKEYTIQYYAKSNVQNEYSQGITIESASSDGVLSVIENQFSPVGKDYEFMSYKFNTAKDTSSILLKVYNYCRDSYTMYKDIRILDSEGNIVKKFDKLKLLPETLVDRILDINLKTENASLRMSFLKDGLKIVKDNFLFGTGGGGWHTLYRRYQSIQYDTKEAHNFYLQYAIETGLIGIAVLISIYYMIFRNAYRNMVKFGNYERLPLYIALLMIMGHSLLDFDLSLASLAFLFWYMVGMIGEEPEKELNASLQRPVIKFLLVACSMIVVYFSSSTYIGMLYGNKAASLVTKDIGNSIVLYEKAIRRDPYNINYYLDYAQLLNERYKASGNSNELVKFEKTLEWLIDKNTGDIKENSIIIKLLLETGKLEKAIEILNNTVKSNLMVAEVYMYKIDVNYQIAKFYFSNKEQKKAIPYLNGILESEQQFKDANSIAIKKMEQPEKMDDMVGLAENWLKHAESR